jgi:hypothetical protein
MDWAGASTGARAIDMSEVGRNAAALQTVPVLQAVRLLLHTAIGAASFFFLEDGEWVEPDDEFMRLVETVWRPALPDVLDAILAGGFVGVHMVPPAFRILEPLDFNVRLHIVHGIVQFRPQFRGSGLLLGDGTHEGSVVVVPARLYRPTSRGALTTPVSAARAVWARQEELERRAVMAERLNANPFLVAEHSQPRVGNTVVPEGPEDAYEVFADADAEDRFGGGHEITRSYEQMAVYAAQREVMRAEIARQIPMDASSAALRRLRARAADVDSAMDHLLMLPQNRRGGPMLRGFPRGDLTALAEMAEQRICTMFGMPPRLVFGAHSHALETDDSFISRQYKLVVRRWAAAVGDVFTEIFRAMYFGDDDEGARYEIGVRTPQVVSMDVLRQLREADVIDDEEFVEGMRDAAGFDAVPTVHGKLTVPATRKHTRAKGEEEPQVGDTNVISVAQPDAAEPDDE